MPFKRTPANKTATFDPKTTPCTSSFAKKMDELKNKAKNKEDPLRTAASDWTRAPVTSLPAVKTDPIQVAQSAWTRG